MGRTVLHEAAEKGDSETLQRLLSGNHNLNVNEEDYKEACGMCEKERERLWEREGEVVREISFILVDWSPSLCESEIERESD